jgi:hypothetical protein
MQGGDDTSEDEEADHDVDSDEAPLGQRGAQANASAGHKVGKVDQHHGHADAFNVATWGWKDAATSRLVLVCVQGCSYSQLYAGRVAYIILYSL